MFAIRKAYTRNVNLINDLTIRGKATMRFKRVSQVLRYQGKVFLITRSLAKIGKYELLIEPYYGRFPRIVLFIRNFKEKYFK